MAFTAVDDSARRDDLVIGVKADATVHIDVPVERLDQFRKRRVDVGFAFQVSVGKLDPGVSGDYNGGMVPPGGGHSGPGDKHGPTDVRDSVSDDVLDGVDGEVLGIEDVLSPVVVDNDPSSHGGVPSSDGGYHPSVEASPCAPESLVEVDAPLVPQPVTHVTLADEAVAA